MKSKRISLTLIKSEENLADIYTKALGKLKFELISDRMVYPTNASFFAKPDILWPRRIMDEAKKEYPLAET